MSKALPHRPSLRHFHLQAKRFVESHRSSTSEASSRIRQSHPRFRDTSEDEILESRFSLADAYLVIAREYGFGTWTHLKQRIEALHLIDTRAAKSAHLVTHLVAKEPRKAAILMILVGPEVNSKIMANLDDVTIEKIARTINSIRGVTPDQEDETLVEFVKLLEQEVSDKS